MTEQNHTKSNIVHPLIRQSRPCTLKGEHTFTLSLGRVNGRLGIMVLYVVGDDFWARKGMCDC